jgi:hypothetical protein
MGLATKTIKSFYDEYMYIILSKVGPYDSFLYHTCYLIAFLYIFHFISVMYFLVLYIWENII